MHANTITEQLTAAGRAIEHDSFAIIDAEAGAHAYSAGQWPIVRRMIHANADFEFNGLTEFHPEAVEAGLKAIRAVQAMKKAHRLGLLGGAIVGIGNAPTALIELVRMIREDGVRPALVIGMPVGFVSAAESKALLGGVDAVPWITIRGRRGWRRGRRRRP